MVVCLSVFALSQTAHLSRVYRTSRPMAAGIGSSPPAPELDMWKKFMEYWKLT